MTLIASPASRLADEREETIEDAREQPPRAEAASEQQVDEASRASFPASDAPSLTCVTGIRLR